MTKTTPRARYTLEFRWRRVLSGRHQPGQRRERITERQVATSIAPIKTHLVYSSKRGLAATFVRCLITAKKYDRWNRLVQSTGGAPAASG